MTTSETMALEKEFYPEEAPPSYYPPQVNQQYVRQPYPCHVAPNMSQYNQNFMSTTQVINSQPQFLPPTVIVQGAYVPRPSNFMCLSCCVAWCCNPLFGLIAFVFSLMSSSAADGGNFKSARAHGRIALSMNIIGIIITLSLLTALIVVSVDAMHD